MADIINKDRLNNLAGEIWKSAERLRGKFKAYEYQSVILPIIVIRRIECVLIDWRERQADAIRQKRPDLSDDQLIKMVKKLEMNPAMTPFSNATDWTLRKICEEDPTLMEKNFRAYLKGFSENIQDIIEHFDYRAVVGRMVRNSRLSPILRQYSTLELGPENLSNLEMGYVYEELLRRFSEQSGEEAGEHFTPREVIRLMVELLHIPVPKKHIAVYDPACGTGGMLSVAKEYLLEKANTDAEKSDVERFVTLHGQELQPGNYAICQSDMLIKAEKDAEIRYGNSLIPHSPTGAEPGDQLAGPAHVFDYMLSNPPFGVTWGGKDGYEHAARKYRSTRYAAGMPRTNDGALLFLQTMLAKMKPANVGGSRIAIIFNGSPLSNGDCGSGESEIRRWILENDFLDAIVMLPDQLFYNTGIFTYIWLLTNRKPASHKGRVMLIDARRQFEKEPRSFGNKRNRITDSHRHWIEGKYRSGWDNTENDPNVRIFQTTDFAYHKVSVVFWQTDENDQPAMITEPFTKAFTPANIKKEQEFFDSDIDFHIQLRSLETEADIEFTLTSDGNFAKEYERRVKKVFAKEIRDRVAGIEDAKARNKAVKQFINSLETVATYTHRHYVGDHEYIPYGENIEAFLKREIGKPVIRWNDAFQPGYEILPNKYFYEYTPPRPAEELLKEFWELEEKATFLIKNLQGN